ncbi:MAG: hypothetical protein AB1529_06875 [Candidatus Micrarchaeota archaeon]
MRLLMLLLAGALLFAGCATPPAGNQTGPVQTPPAQPNATPPAMACSEYCLTLPHIQCVGEWKISGTYPNCVCEYECTTANETGNGEPETNATPPAAPPEEPLATPTTKSVSQLLYDAMARTESDFYRENDGSFIQKNYTWVRKTLQPGGLAYDAPADDVKFDGKAIASIEAFGYTVFEDQADDVKKAYGAAIFKAKTTPLDSYTGSDAFDINYFYQQENGLLKDCWAYTRDYNVNQADDWLVTYVFRCEKVLDK